jgi:hypothetical protein
MDPDEFGAGLLKTPEEKFPLKPKMFSSMSQQNVIESLMPKDNLTRGRGQTGYGYFLGINFTKNLDNLLRWISQKFTLGAVRFFQLFNALMVGR